MGLVLQGIQRNPETHAMRGGNRRRISEKAPNSDVKVPWTYLKAGGYILRVSAITMSR